ncbi:hypothetical protein MPTA5024_18385 [Microbispora sp. ATCC PTA-5024]|nr:hypothetical protein MPTA5024_18385 [Microbispora sp. ATCC PTA-5024]
MIPDAAGPSGPAASRWQAKDVKESSWPLMAPTKWR